MRRTNLRGLALFTCLALSTGCGGGSRNSPSGTPVSLTIRDTPANVAILSFEVAITGAKLEPGDVPLVTTPVEIEFEKLETEIGVLSTAGVQQPGPFSSVQITFANPELTFKNTSTTATIAGCAPQAVCELKPPALVFSPATVTVPLPTSLTLNGNSPVGLVLDFDLNASVQNDLSINPKITIAQVSPTQPEAEMEEINDVDGVVTAVGSNQFTLQDNSSGLSFMINVDNNTRFADFDQIGCTPQNFSCVKMGQILEVDLAMLGDGMFLATRVEHEGDVNEQEVEGKITSVDSATQFHMVIEDEEPNIAGIAVGDPVAVTILPNASFLIDADGLSVSGFSFASSADLLVGQEVEVRLVGAASPSGVSADRVTLKTSQFTAQVVSTNAPNFTVATQPGSLFANAGINQIQVQTSSATEFEGVTGVSALNPNDTVSLRGLLFNTAGNPTLAAKKVRKR